MVNNKNCPTNIVKNLYVSYVAHSRLNDKIDCGNVQPTSLLQQEGLNV